MPTETSEPRVVISEKTTSQSLPFVGQWNQLISTTNWEKGAIISQWRKSLEQDGVPVTEFSDEAWAQLVGGVSPQHVGRLRRTHDRFGHVFQEYEGIYWSHFYAALDWDDAEMWLEGAVQSKWSVSQMRKQRWETLGKVGAEPQDQEIVATESNEETQSLALSENPRNNDRDYIEGPVHEGPDWGDDSPSSDRNASSSSATENDAASAAADAPETTQPHAIRPFESFDNLPDDVMDAANAFKVAIIRHKAADWEEVSLDDMLGMLDALKRLASIAAE